MSTAIPVGGVTASAPSGWASLFWTAFKRSRNAMIVLDERRCPVEVNGACLQLLGYRRSELIGRPVYELVSGGPALSNDEWRLALIQPRFSTVANLICADGSGVLVEFAGHPAAVDGTRVVLVVALRTARGGRRLPDADGHGGARGALTKRELEVVELMALGATGPEIADDLHITHNTVRTHVRNAMTKLGARSRAQLVAIALAERYVVTSPA